MTNMLHHPSDLFPVQIELRTILIRQYYKPSSLSQCHRCPLCWYCMSGTFSAQWSVLSKTIAACVCVCLILIKVRYCMSGDFCAQSVCSCFVLSVFLIWLLELFLCIITTSCFNPVMGHGSAMVAASGIMSLRQLSVLRITHLVGDLVSITLAKLTFSRPFYNNILLKHIL